MGMNKLKQQTLYPTDFYHLQPVDLSNPNFRFMMFNVYSKLRCPFYAPVVPDGICRLCHCNARNHRKYYIYSNYARKIQFVFFKYQFKKFYQRHFQKFKKLGNKHLPLPAAIIKFKILYYRNWSEWTLNNF